MPRSKKGAERRDFIRKVTRVPLSPKKALQRQRVAAYARVSSGKDAMLQSLSAQISYYNKYIQQRGDWQFAGAYADEAITGTKDVRAEFQRMLTDCRDRKIDMIITKSITRFARNTVILLETVRELKLLGVDVFFEKENIHSISADGEFILTLLASYAQEESRSVSENQKWRIRRIFEKGRPNTGNMLGYRLLDGKLYIVPEEAEIVRMIFADYLSGMGRNAIMKKLTELNIPTRYGKVWRESTVEGILRNEKYTGDMLLQKTYIADHITKKKCVNKGEVPQYYVENSHPAIIDPETWELVQSEIKKRTSVRRQVNNNSPFAAKVICGQCGGFYGSKVWHSADQYRTHIWQCNRKYKDGTFCDTLHVRENALELAFVAAFNRILGNKAQYIRQFEELIPLLADTTALEAKHKKLIDEQTDADNLLHRCIVENAQMIQDQDEYKRKYTELVRKITALSNQIIEVDDEILECAARKEKIRRFLSELQNAGDIVTEFDENLWNATVDTLTVCSSKEAVVTFRDGTEISVEMSDGK